jgi:probable rRNA maturation factor
MIHIHSTLKDSFRSNWGAIADTVLGKKYELSLMICGDARARAINKRTRKKTYSPNVLSFPFSSTEGEIILNPRKAAREAHRYGRNAETHLLFLFIHGLLHLKGMDHGSTMEAAEQKFLRKFATHTL